MTCRECKRRPAELGGRSELCAQCLATARKIKRLLAEAFRVAA